MKKLIVIFFVMFVTISLFGCKGSKEKSIENFTKEDFETSLNIMSGDAVKLEISSSSDKDVLILNGDRFYHEHIPQTGASRWDTYYKEIFYKDNEKYVELTSSIVGVFVDDTKEDYSSYKRIVDYSSKDYFKDRLFDTIDWSDSADYPSIIFFSLDDYKNILGTDYFDDVWDEYYEEAMFVYNYLRDLDNWELIDDCYKLDLYLMWAKSNYTYNEYFKEENPDMSFEEYIERIGLNDHRFKEYLVLCYEKSKIVKYEYHGESIPEFVVNITYGSETIDIPKLYKLDVKKSYNIKKGIYSIDEAFKNEVFKSYDNVTWLSSNEEIIYIRDNQIYCTGYDKNNNRVTFARIAGDYISLFECTIVE